MPPSSLGVRALDRHTLRVDLEYAMPYFNKMMVMPAFFPQNTGYVKKFGDKYGTNSARVACNGAFKVQGWTGTNDKWSLTPNTHYYDRKNIRMDKMVMQIVKDSNTAHQLFQENKLDDAQITGTTAQGLQKNKNLMHLTRGGVYYLRMNLAENRAFSNKNLRHAVYLALDRNELAKKVLSDGSTASGTYVARKLATDPTTGRDFATEMTPSETFNMKKAKELWNKGMKELGKSSVTLDLVTDDQTVSKNVGQFVQSKVETNFKGAKVNVESVPSKSSSGKVSNGDFDMNLTLWLADFANPVSDFDVLSSSNPQNYGKYNSPAYDSQLAQARRNGNDEKAFWQNMRNAQQLLNDDMPVVPLYTMTESHLVNPKLSGVLYHSVGETDYTRAYFK
jgi:ABC-type oligopeptide transport system substrate-binding subunit